MRTGIIVTWALETKSVIELDSFSSLKFPSTPRCVHMAMGPTFDYFFFSFEATVVRVERGKFEGTGRERKTLSQ